jgi:hypothetical protein
MQLKFFILFALISPRITAQNLAFVWQQIEELTNSEVKVVQIGENNLVTGFINEGKMVEDAQVNLQYAAWQHSQSGGSNKLHVEQLNPTVRNEIVLYQEAYGNNEGILKQADGSHTLMLKEISLQGSNTGHITQLNGSGYINLEQRAYLCNTIPPAANTIMENPTGFTGIYQEGQNNFIYGASVGYDPDFGDIAVPASGLPALQVSETGSNWLEIWQTGGNNTVALYQEAVGDNIALIKQFDGFNIAVIYQKGVGFNNIKVEQFGGAEAYIYQKGGSNNNAVIEQW